MKNYLVARLKEPSTWRGLILCITAFKLNVDPDQAVAIASLGLALAGGIGVVTPENLNK